MPFVAITVRRSTSIDTKRKIEQACKEIWVSMNGVAGASGLKESDVGGVVWNRGVGLGTVRFFYDDRGNVFD